ncbi:hypothetical protein G6F35_014033 [Rhizopus arrhizus]|nr:hypothetical protein G6F35_014033 [Rhizopus arrhizus]
MLAAFDQRVADAVAGHQQVFRPDRGQPGIDQRQQRLPARIAEHAGHFQQRGRRIADAVAGVDDHGHQRRQRQEGHFGDVAQAEPHGDQRNPGKQRYLLEGVEAGAHDPVEQRQQPQQRTECQAQRGADRKARQLARKAGAERPPQLARGDLVGGGVQHLAGGHQQRRRHPSKVCKRPPRRDGHGRQHQAAPAGAQPGAPGGWPVRRRGKAGLSGGHRRAPVFDTPRRVPAWLALTRSSARSNSLSMA